MDHIRKLIPVVAFILLGGHLPAQSYQQDIQRWDEERVKELTAPNGWVNLAGLFWLKEGDNSFGSGEGNDIRFPDGKSAPRTGILSRQGYRVFLKNANGVTINGRAFSEGLVFDADSTNNPMMAYGDLRWFVIKRDNKVGIRLRDLKHPALAKFKGIERFPVDTNMRIRARFEPHPVPTSIPITNMLGQTYKQFSPGLVHCRINGKDHTFIALEEEGMLFIVFGDETNGVETYSSGRFLKAVNPQGPGETILDFNKAYNPPCAFTPYATCPLPPKQNQLSFALRAGEKSTH